MKLKCSVAIVFALGVWLAVTSSGVARADGHQPIHPDCINSPWPQLCTDMVTDLITELASFNQAFNPPNANDAAAFYHERATLYTSATGTFYVGRDSIRNYFFAIFAGVKSATVDASPFHYSVISPTTIISYGKLPATIVLNNGFVITQPPLPQTLTWIRNEGFDRKRPFVIISDHE